MLSDAWFNDNQDDGPPADVEDSQQTAHIRQHEISKTDPDALLTALEYLGLEYRKNLRAGRYEIRRFDRNKTALNRRWYLDRKIIKPDKELLNNGWIVLTDDLQNDIRDEISRNFWFNTTRGAVPALFSGVAFTDGLSALMSRAPCDPIADWLDTLPAWDKTPRLDTIFIDALGAEDTALNREVGAKLLIGAVARSESAGCLHDWLPVVVGEQGCGKSTFALSLVPGQHREDWFSDSIDLSKGRKEAIDTIGSALIVEFGELVGIHRRELVSLKSFLSSGVDTVRLSYDRRSAPHPRRWIAIGTANDDGSGVLPYDPTGYRRFAVVKSPLPYQSEAKTRRVRNYMEAKREQLWAEAIHRNKEAEAKRTDHTDEAHHVLSYEVHVAQTLVAQSIARTADDLEDLAENATRKWLGSEQGVSIAQLLLDGKIEDTLVAAGKNRGAQIALAKYLTERKWVKDRRYVAAEGKQRTLWFAPSLQDAAPAVEEARKSVSEELIGVDLHLREGWMFERAVGELDGQLVQGDWCLRAPNQEEYDRAVQSKAYPVEIAILKPLAPEPPIDKETDMTIFADRMGYETYYDADGNLTLRKPDNA